MSTQLDVVLLVDRVRFEGVHLWTQRGELCWDRTLPARLEAQMHWHRRAIAAHLERLGCTHKRTALPPLREGPTVEPARAQEPEPGPGGRMRGQATLPLDVPRPLGSQGERRAVRWAQAEVSACRERRRCVEEAIGAGREFDASCLVGVAAARPGALKEAPAVPPSMLERLVRCRLELREAQRALAALQGDGRVAS